MFQSKWGRLDMNLSSNPNPSTSHAVSRSQADPLGPPHVPSARPRVRCLDGVSTAFSGLQLHGLLKTGKTGSSGLRTVSVGHFLGRSSGRGDRWKKRTKQLGYTKGLFGSDVRFILENDLATWKSGERSRIWRGRRLLSMAWTVSVSMRSQLAD